MVWTRFMDTHSGGGRKLDWEYIFIEAPKGKAQIIFQNRFNRNPNRVTCTCCGEDYSIDEHKTLEQATAYERNCRYAYFDKDGNRVDDKKAWKPNSGMSGKYVEEQNQYEEYKEHKYQTMEDFMKTKQFKDGDKALLIPETEIKPEERQGELCKEGYVWMD